MADDNRTRAMGAAPSVDPNKTVMGTAPSLNATITIKPVQCPVCKESNPPGVMYCNACGLIFEMALDGDAFGAPAVQLPVLVDETGREHQLRPGANSIGRQGDILIEDTRVSRMHAVLTMDGDEASVEDSGSTNGTKVGGEPLAEGEKKKITSGDVVSLGGYEMTFRLPGEASKTQMAMSGKTVSLQSAPTVQTALAWLVIDDSEEIPLEAGVHTFGRRTDNDIVISDPYISGRHGTITVDETGVYLTDTGSSNGTIVNDAKLVENQKTQLQADDVVKLGDKTLTIKFRE